MTNLEIWETAHQWLVATGNKVSRAYCKREITAHPDYPSLISLTDFLDSGGMYFKAVRYNSSAEYDFHYPIIIHVKPPGREYLHLLEKREDWQADKDIIKHWSGIAIFTKPNSKWVSDDFTEYKRERKIWQYSVALFSILALTLFAVFSIQHFTIQTFLLSSTSMAGLLLSILVEISELGFHVKGVRELCDAIKPGGCDSVLQSRYAKGILGISAADFSLSYFVSQLSFIYLSIYNTNFLSTVYIYALVGPVISGWSLYTQRVKLKQWCTLCLLIVTVLMSQFFASIASTVVQVSSWSIILFILCGLLILLAVRPIKHLIRLSINGRFDSLELKKWKLDIGIFEKLLNGSPEVDTYIDEDELYIGQRDAPVTMTVVCNPYCKPCAAAHFKLDQLLQNFHGKIKIQIRLLFVSMNSDNKLAIASRAILQVAKEHENDPFVVQDVLNDWFEWMDFEKWRTKWKPKEQFEVDEVMKSHIKWIDRNNIISTPSIFLEGRRIPSRYTVTDFVKLIPQFIENLEEELI